LVVTGTGCVKKSGVFALAADSLKKAGVSIAECTGIEPNPRIKSVARGAQIAKSEGCDVVIAIGPSRPLVTSTASLWPR